MIKIKFIIVILLLFHSCSNDKNKRTNNLDVRSLLEIKDQYDLKIENKEDLDLIIKRNIDFKNDANCNARFIIQFITTKDFNGISSVSITKRDHLIIDKQNELKLLLELKELTKISVGKNGREYYQALDKSPAFNLIVNGKKYCNELTRANHKK
ncbi:hypothetical protein [Mangrovimonas sp. TPBH4]|uniref:hypothetical protein n=1 Tax=Mangrovimonas sp. TPBH4 TaxID=1645914 RepID=UPI0006B5A20F|nr:hypothetical protein [Mangrovimonas sp. TPBH4]